MINYFMSGIEQDVVSFIGIMAAFFLTCIFMVKCSGLLPKDAGEHMHTMENFRQGNREVPGLYLYWYSWE